MRLSPLPLPLRLAAGAALGPRVRAFEGQITVDKLYHWPNRRFSKTGGCQIVELAGYSLSTLLSDALKEGPLT